MLLLDASVILAYLHGEPGRDQVDAVLELEDCLMTAANHAEVVIKCLDRGVAADVVGPMLVELGYRVIPVTETDGLLAGQLRSSTRRQGLSLGDRLCLAVAQRLGSPVLTSDRPWLELAEPLGLDIRCIRPGSH
ncbi:MAG: type II toxin-antitoxin system VapC family toxin [Azospira sp.]|jgi:PIN domain nuclease of toxin-antitoxin system|nr:type II toxin-antitoxin system VapC family toxin [Azospira sp.]